MTVVTEDNLSDAVQLLASDLVAQTRFRLTNAENETKRAYARAYLTSNQATVDAKKASAELNDGHVRAKDHEAECERDHVAAQGQTKWAETVRDIWRSENKNARTAESIF